MKILFLCNTVYQIIVASCIRCMYQNCRAEIILSDHSAINQKVYEKLNDTRIFFDKAYYVKSKYLYDVYTNESFMKDIKKFNEDKIGNNNSLFPFSSNFDMFFCANAEPYSELIVNYLYENNSKIKICWYEDGLSAYYFDKKCFQRGIKGKIKQIIKRLFGIRELTELVSDYFVFRPEKMEWKPKAEIHKVNIMTKEHSQKLADLFSYSPTDAVYKEKYIFFEDGVIEWSKNADLRLVEKIAKVVGRENILIKLHPRNPNDRFTPLGYKTDKNSGIAWEILSANIDLQNKTLITMYSQSIITAEILTGNKCKAIILGKLDPDYKLTGHDLFDYIDRNYYLDSKNYFVPENFSELEKFLSNISKEVS